MGAMAPQITNLTIVYSTVYPGADQRKHQSSASLAFVRGIHRLPVNTPHKGPVTRKMFLFDDVITTKLHQERIKWQKITSTTNQCTYAKLHQVPIIWSKWNKAQRTNIHTYMLNSSVTPDMTKMNKVQETSNASYDKNKQGTTNQCAYAKQNQELIIWQKFKKKAQHTSVHMLNNTGNS